MKLEYADPNEHLVIPGGRDMGWADNASYDITRTLNMRAYDPNHITHGETKKTRVDNSIKALLETAANALQTDSVSWNCPRPMPQPGEPMLEYWHMGYMLRYRGYHRWYRSYSPWVRPGFAEEKEGPVYAVKRGREIEAVTAAGETLTLRELTPEEYNPDSRRGYRQWAFDYDGPTALLYAVLGMFYGSAGYGGIYIDFVFEEEASGRIVVRESSNCD